MSVSIYYGSQTGTAESFAEEVASLGKRFALKCEVIDLDDFEEEMLTETDDQTVHVFCLASFGEGDPTDNCFDTNAWLQSYEGKLSNVKFTVFGLGNTQYEFYNAVGIYFDKRLEELGAKRVHQLGLGDDDATMEEDMEAWTEELFPNICMNLFGEIREPIEDVFESKYTCKVTPTAPADVVTKDGHFDRRQQTFPKGKIALTSRHYFSALPLKVLEKRELRQKSGGKHSSTLHLELDLRRTPFKYRTADNLLLLPENEPAQVKALGEQFELNLDNWITLTPKNSKDNGPLIPNCQIRTALTSFCDLNGAPDRQFLRRLSNFTTAEDETARLKQLSSKEGHDEYMQWGHKKMKTVFQALQEFKSLKVPNAGVLVEILPRMQPRWYTIASSNIKYPQDVHVALSMVEKDDFNGLVSKFVTHAVSKYEGKAAAPTPKPKKKQGMFGRFAAALGISDTAAPSSVIEDIPNGQRVYGYIKPSTFKMPRNATKPIIMIGPGTGIAPMRAFLQQREAQVEQVGKEKVGESLLFFGCRKKDEDYLYKDELEKYKSDGVLTQLHLAFSRETPGKKVYVQDLVKAEGDALWDLVHNKGAYTFVCGAAEMGHAVRAVMTDIAATHGNMSPEEAEKYVKNLQRNERYIAELWSD